MKPKNVRLDLGGAMGIVAGVLAVAGAITKLSWLAVLGGLLAIAMDAVGYMTGALHGCLPTLVSYILGVALGGGLLFFLGLSPVPAMLGGIALAAAIGDVQGILLQRRMSSG